MSNTIIVILGGLCGSALAGLFCIGYCVFEAWFTKHYMNE